MSRLIIVPPLYQNFDPGHNHTINVGGVVARTDMTAAVPMPQADPVDALLSYYLPPKINLATAKHAYRAVTPGFESGLRRALAEEWVAQNCTLPAIAQWGTEMGTGQWSYWLCDGTLRRDQFYNWALSAAQHQLQEFHIVLPENEKIALAKEIDESVRELIRGKSFISHNGPQVCVSVWDATDAVEFKLKWSDYFHA